MRLTAVTAQEITGDGDRWLDALNNALIRWEISTPARVAMFLAQCGHESGGFKHLVENLHYSAAALLATWPSHFTPEEALAMAYDEQRIAERAYGGRMGNGSEGDGYRYRGRGIIQLTGRDNYARCGQAIGLDFVAQPELLEQPEWAAASAGWFWATHGCNALADAGDFETITQRINGGLNGQADRETWLAKMRTILGTPATPPVVHATQPAAPIEDKSTPLPASQQETTHMGAIALPLLAQLIPQVLGLFSARAQATIAEKTGADPKLAQQFMQGLIQAVGDKIGIAVNDDATAVQAVGQLTAKIAADPAAMAPTVKDLEDHSLDYLHKLTESMQMLVDVRKAEVQVETQSADSAAARTDASDVRQRIDQKVWWAYGIAGAILAVIAIVELVITSGIDGQIIGALILAFGALGGAIITMVNYGYGSSGSSGAKDVLIGEMARRQSNGGT